LVIFSYVVMCIIFGTTFLAIKIGIDAGAPPLFFAGIRFFTAGLLLILWMTMRGKVAFRLLLRKEQWITGLCLTFVPFAALYWAERYVTSGVAAVLSSTGPLFIILIQILFLRHQASAKTIYGGLLGFAGVILLLAPSLSLEADWFVILGAAAIVGSEFFYSLGTVYLKRTAPRFSNTSPLVLNAAQMLTGGLSLLIFSLLTETVRFDAILARDSLGALLYLTVIGSIVGHSLYYWLVIKTNPVFPSTWLYISPLIALAIGIGWYGEQASVFTVIGAIAIIAGTFYMNNGLRTWSYKKKTNRLPIQ